MKQLLASSFDEFMSGNGIWIVIGVLAGALIITTVFLILNILKEKKSKEVEHKAEFPNDEPKTENILESKNKNTVEIEKEPVEQTKTKPSNKKVSKANAEKQTEKKVAKPKTEKVESEAKPEKEQKVSYGVTYDKENREWVVRKSGSSRASKRCATKEEALEVAEKLSKQNNATLRVHKKNGKFQKQ